MKYDQGCNLLIHRIERSEINIKGIENVFYEIITENFLNLQRQTSKHKRCLKFQIDIEVSSKHKSNCNIIQCKETILKAEREKTPNHKDKHIRIQNKIRSLISILTSQKTWNFVTQQRQLQILTKTNGHLKTSTN